MGSSRLVVGGGDAPGCPHHGASCVTLNVSAGGAPAVLGDIRQAPFPDRSFDRILFERVPFDLLLDGRSLTEARRLVRAGGFVHLVTGEAVPIGRLLTMVAVAGFGRVSFRSRGELVCHKAPATAALEAACSPRTGYLQRARLVEHHNDLVAAMAVVSADDNFRLAIRRAPNDLLRYVAAETAESAQVRIAYLEDPCREVVVRAILFSRGEAVWQAARVHPDSRVQAAAVSAALLRSTIAAVPPPRPSQAPPGASPGHCL